jgi:hypothetical protein
LLRSYNLHFDEVEKIYFFSTDNRINYRVLLTERKELVSDYPELDLRVIELTFYPDREIKTVADPRIEATITHLLKDVFSKIENALLIVYDSSDGKHRARKILFEKWFKRNTDSNLEKINFEIESVDVDIKGMFLFRKDHPQHDLVFNVVKELKDEMQSYK